MKTLTMTDCTFGTRTPMDIKMLNEIIRREVKHFRNYKVYRPNFGSRPVTGKFYAAHDQLQTGSPEERATEEQYYQRVARTRALGPRTKYPAPATGNQEYGWHSSPLLPADRSDRRLCFPQVESAHTKLDVIIAQCNPKIRRRKDA